MLMRFTDIINQLRAQFIDNIEYIMDNCQTSVQCNRAILHYFYALRSSNYQLYKNIVGLMASDHYKIINELKRAKSIGKEDFPYMELYETISNQDELICVIEKEPIILLEILYCMKEFNDSDYFENRYSYLLCKYKLDVLKKLSPYSTLDYLYYCQDYDINALKYIYDEQLEIYDKEDVIHILVSTINRLFESDLECYKNLISELLANYYIIGKNQLQHGDKIIKRHVLERNIQRIENKDMVFILNILQKREYTFLSDILERILDNKEGIKDYSDNEIGQKTLKKINDIKNLNINTIE